MSEERADHRPLLRSDIAFTDSVKAAQQRRGSRTGYEAALRRRDWSRSISDDLAAFIAEQDTFFLATASSCGQPYLQHRGGPPGVLKVLDDHTLGFADYSGNRQYITVGNLDENPQAFLFLLDFAHRRRVKLWGRAEVMEQEQDPALIEALSHPEYPARVERAIVFHVEAWDVNCRQHIRPRFTVEQLPQQVVAAAGGAQALLETVGQ